MFEVTITGTDSPSQVADMLRDVAQRINEEGLDFETYRYARRLDGDLIGAVYALDHED